MTIIRTPGGLWMPVAVVLASTAAPASAKYTEAWMSNADIARAESRATGVPRKTKAARAASTAHVHASRLSTGAVATTDDDPIAAFARAPNTVSGTTTR